LADRPQLELGPRALHVWRADLASVPDCLSGILSHSERARAERFPTRSKGQLWARGRGVLRALVGRYLERDPRTLSFAPGPHGKPCLLDEPSLHFSMSHSGGVAVYGFTKTGPIGVDVELARKPIPTLALAERAFGPLEAERLRLLDPGGREQEFLRAWVRWEAELKRCGIGVGAPDESAGREQPESWIAELEVGPQAAAAVALGAAPTELRCWELRGEALAV
jgi:4'-phosphopantetheinyl transferase